MTSSPDRRPETVRLALTLVSAVAYGASFPTTSWRLLAWVALVPLLLAVRGVPSRKALGLGFLWGTLAACATAGWMPDAIVRYWGQPWLVGLAVLLGGAVLTASLFYMLFTVWYARVTRRVRATTPLLAAAAWVATELGRTEALIGNPWALLGYSQVDSLRLLQIADLAGVYGVGFPIVAVNAAIAEWIAAERAGDRGGLRRAALGALGAAVILVFVAGYGAWRLAAALAGDEETSAEIVVVQGNLDLGSQWREEHFGANLQEYLTLTEAALLSSPRLVVWPENAMTFFVEEEAAYRAIIGATLSSRNVELLAGGPRKSRGADGETRFLNSAFVLDPSGAVRAVYEKQLLVPFAEAFPLAGAGWLRERFGRVREFAPGAATRPLPTAVGPAGVLICNEAMFPGLAAERVRAGSGWLVNLTNDSWVGSPRYAAIAADMETLRAVEQRRFLVRASTSGPSRVVDPFGHVRAEAPFPSAATISARVASRSELTPYARLGDAFAWGCLLLALVGFFVARAQEACDDLPAGAGLAEGDGTGANAPSARETGVEVR